MPGVLCTKHRDARMTICLRRQMRGELSGCGRQEVEQRSSENKGLIGDKAEMRTVQFSFKILLSIQEEEHAENIQIV